MKGNVFGLIGLAVILAAVAHSQGAPKAGLSAEEQARMAKITRGDLSAATNEVERFYALNRAAKKALKAGKTEEARGFANELARLAPAYTNDWNYGNAIQDSNQVLGRIALKEGNVAEAKKRLLDSAESKGSPQMNSFGPNMQLAKELLAKGETQVVVDYLQRCERFWKMGSDRLAGWAQAINMGETPNFGANLEY